MGRSKRQRAKARARRGPPPGTTSAAARGPRVELAVRDEDQGDARAVIAQPKRSTAAARSRAARGVQAARPLDIGAKRAMQKEPVPYFVLSIIEGTVLGRPYPLSSSHGLPEHQAFIRAAYIDSGRIHEMLFELLDALPMGIVVAQPRWRVETVRWTDKATGERHEVRDALVVQRLEALRPEDLGDFLHDKRGDVSGVEWGDEVIPAGQLVIATWRGRYGVLRGESIFEGARNPQSDKTDHLTHHDRYLKKGGLGGMLLGRTPVVRTRDGLIDREATRALSKVLADALANLETLDVAALPSLLHEGTEVQQYGVEALKLPDVSNTFRAALSYDDEQVFMGMGVAERALGIASDGNRSAARIARDATLLPQLAAIDLMLRTAINRGVFWRTTVANFGAAAEFPRLRGVRASKERERLLLELFRATAKTRVKLKDGREFEAAHLLDQMELLDEADYPIRPLESLHPLQPGGTIGRDGRPPVEEDQRSPESRDDVEKEEGSEED